MSKKKKLLITASLLNSWRYLFTVDDAYYEKSFEEFKGTLRREEFETNQFIEAGFEFENKAIEGKVAGVSEFIKGGSFQLRATKDKIVDGQHFLMYGRLDVLKNSRIIDLKHKWNLSKYVVGEYLDGIQHHFYMEIVPEAKEFIYIIGNKNSEKKFRETGQEYSIRKETITRKECVDMEQTIRDFINWLKLYDLYDLYEKHWEALK